MNDRYFFNIFLVLFSYLLYASGILTVLMKLLVKKGLYVFNYHSFNTLENDYWRFGSLFLSNYQENFERQIKFFNRFMKGVDTPDFGTVSLAEPKYILTFDDGYKDNCAIALPVLKKYSTPSIFFITTGPVGTNDLLWYDKVRFFYENKKRRRGLGSMVQKKEMKARLTELKKLTAGAFEESLKLIEQKQDPHGPLMMDWDEVKKAHGDGMFVGSHTHTHPILTRLDLEEQKKEIQTSLDMIRKNLNVVPFLFSYPEGDRKSFSKETVDFLKSAGIRYAFTVANGVNLDMETPFHLKRIGIKASDPIPVTALKIIRAALIKAAPGASQEGGK
jgi:peptidoglycan/xylan/chitin deacetylase (PgdA/CDA1 family)